MPKLTRRSLLPNSFGVLAGGTLARPYIANAAAKSATAWWVQGFAQEEDVAFKTLSPSRTKASGNTIDYPFVPSAPHARKSSWQWLAALSRTSPLTTLWKPSRCMRGTTSCAMSVTSSKPRNRRTVKRHCSLRSAPTSRNGVAISGALHLRDPAEAHLAAARRKSGTHSKMSRKPGMRTTTFQRGAKTAACPRFAQSLRVGFPTEHNRQRSRRLVRLLPNRPMMGKTSSPKTASCMLTIRCQGGGDQDAHISDHRLQERLRTAGSDQVERCRRQQRLLREAGHGPRWHDLERGRDAVTREQGGLRRHREDGPAAVQ